MPCRSLAGYLENFYRRGSDVACVQPRGYRRICWTYRQVADTARQFAAELEARVQALAREDPIRQAAAAPQE